MDQQTIDSYNELAEKYDEETQDFWSRFPRTFLDKFIRLSGKGDVLDLGSGPGRDAEILREEGCSIVCLDASEKMIQLTEARGLRSVLGDFMALPFEAESFNTVWAYTSLLHIPKKEIELALKEIYRVLKSQGIFGLGLIEGEVEEYRETAKVPKPRLFSFYKKDEVEELMTRFGFELVYFEKFKPNNKNYLNFIYKKS